MASIQLVSLSNVKAFLEIDSSITTYDSLLNSLIMFTSDRIQTFLNRQLNKIQRTQTFDAGYRKYYLQAYPIDTTSISVVLDDTVQDVNDDYYIWSDAGLIEFDFQTSYIEPKQIAITYTGGYTSSLTTIGGNSVYVIVSDLPDAIQFACLLQVAYTFRQKKNLGATSISNPDGSTSNMVGADLLPDVKNILRMHRKSPLGM